jgi:hypothetical protein
MRTRGRATLQNRCTGRTAVRRNRTVRTIDGCLRNGEGCTLEMIVQSRLNTELSQQTSRVAEDEFLNISGGDFFAGAPSNGAWFVFKMWRP